MPAADTAPIAADRQRSAALSFGPFAFDTRRRLLSRGGEEIPLPPRVIGVLELLLDRAGEIVARQELIDAVWKDAFVTDTSLAEAVSVLRQALADDPQSPTYIQTLHRRGYRFVAPISSSPPALEARTVTERPHDATIVSPSIGGQLVPWSAAIICALIAAGAIWQLTHVDRAARPQAARFAIATAPGTALDESAPALAFAPDGSQLAWSACDDSGCRIYIRALDRLDAQQVPGSDDGRAPFFSPDGRWIGFFADGRLKKVAVSGGAPITLTDAPSVLGGVWVEREIIYAGSPFGGLMRIPADGGEPRTLTAPREADGEVRHAWPALVPGSRVLLFTIETTGIDGAPGVLGALSLDAAGSAEASGWRTLAAGVSLARAAAEDTIVLAKGSELEAIAFDPVRIATAGVPHTVLSQVAGAHGLAHYALSATGSLVAANGSETASNQALAWLSTSAVPIASDDVRRLRGASLAPDATKVAGVKVEGGRADVWIADVARGSSTRLTHTGINASPVWSADGRTVYFAAKTNGVFEIWAREADGGQPAARRFSAATNSRHAFPLSASSDGRTLAFVQTAPGRHADIWALPLDGGSARALVQGPFDDISASFSPDSTMLAFQSAEAGRWEVYVMRLRDGRRTVVSTDGGQRPYWTSGGLFFESRGHIVRTSIASAADDIRVEPLARVADLGGGTLRGVSPDGRFLIDRTPTRTPEATVSLEWIREVRALIGPPATALPR